MYKSGMLMYIKENITTFMQIHPLRSSRSPSMDALAKLFTIASCLLYILACVLVHDVMPLCTAPQEQSHDQTNVLENSTREGTINSESNLPGLISTLWYNQKQKRLFLWFSFVISYCSK